MLNDWTLTALIYVSALAPLLAFVSVSLFALFGMHGTALRRMAAGIGVGAAGLAAVSSWVLLASAVSGSRLQAAYNWATLGNRPVEFSVRLDPLGATLAALVSTVALAVTIYSLGYMAEEKRYARYFAYLSLFSGAMLLLVWSGSLLLLYLAWEGVGLASYLLIGFYWERPEAGPAATKAFLLTRIGDIGLLLAILALFVQTGSFDIARNLAAVTSGQISGVGLNVIAILLFIGAAGKSAQIPFQVWLPDAMAGPTPVSALIHSATMVAAGVYLVARMLPLVLAAGGVIVVIGLASTLLASSASLVQPELKQVLAYSTISQLGEMLVALGLGGLAAGTFHLVMQGLFKAALFLAAGNLAHALGTAGRFEFARYGGAGKHLTLTQVAFIIAGLALAGIPVTLAPSSRDPILNVALAQQPLVGLLLMVADFLTAAYITRAYLLTFTNYGTRFASPTAGAGSPDYTNLSERRVMTVPLLTLVGLVVIVGLAGSPLFGEPFKHFVEKDALTTIPPQVNTGLILAISLAVAIAGIATAFLLVDSKAIGRSKASLNGLVAFAASGFGFNWFYNQILVTLALLLMLTLNWFERAVLNRVADWAADGTLRLARQQNRFDVQVVDRAGDSLAKSVGRVSRPLARLQTGQLGNYLFAIFAWGLVALAVAVLLGFL